MKDLDAINDCNEAIKLDPTYGKAYGRLGIAYSNLNKCDLALQAYQTALKYDPTNTMYETNLKVAQERLRTNPGNFFQRNTSSHFLIYAYKFYFRRCCTHTRF